MRIGRLIATRNAAKPIRNTRKPQSKPSPKADRSAKESARESTDDDERAAILKKGRLHIASLLISPRRPLRHCPLQSRQQANSIDGYSAEHAAGSLWQRMG